MPGADAEGVRHKIENKDYKNIGKEELKRIR